MGTWHDHLSEVKFRDFDSSNVTDSGHLIFFLYPLHFDTN